MNDFIQTVCTTIFSQPRIRSETSGRQRSLSFREGLSNIPEPSMLPLDWKPDTSGTLMNYRFQGDHKCQRCSAFMVHRFVFLRFSLQVGEGHPINGCFFSLRCMDLETMFR